MRGLALGIALTLALAHAGCGGKRGDAPPGARDGSSAERPGILELTSEPTPAAVFIDPDKRLGKTPLRLERPGGTRLDLLVVKDGHETHRVSVHFVAGARQEVHARLEKLKGYLIVSAGPLRGASVSIDGVAVGSTPERFAVTAGEPHTVVVSKSGLRNYRETVKVEPGEERPVGALLVPLGKSGGPVGWVTIEVEGGKPALVHLGRSLIGNTPLRRIPLPAGRQELRLIYGEKQQVKKVVARVKAEEHTVIKVELP